MASRRRIPRSRSFVYQLAYLCEGMQEGYAGVCAVGHEPRDVAPVNTASGKQQIIAPATGDAAQLHLAPVWASIGRGSLCAHRQPRISLDAFAYRPRDRFASF